MGHTDQCPEDFLCTVEEVQWLINRLDTAKSNGPDGISARMLKAVASSIAPSVTKLFNLSIALLAFQPCGKRLIQSQFLNQDHSSPSNYRRIHFFQTLSKLLEHHIHFLLTKHSSLHHPISCSQWGFQRGKSTVAALLTATHEWFQQLEAGREVCVCVFFELRKAFDSVPHRALLEKLKQLNLNPVLIRWTCSYLMGRRQKVVVDGESFGTISVDSGVPQESVLGPLLLLIYNYC